MPRPTKLRKISFVPENTYFIPMGIKTCSVEKITLKLEELEAMRLKDLENFSQEECAEKMHISRQTFQLIIDEARRKVAEALTTGKAIDIQGGNYTYNICKYQCEDCGKKFDEALEQENRICPSCGSAHILCTVKEHCCMKPCRKHWCNRR
ncbi:DUF134 domain-containing protein [Geosporobacter ferrireducens]|uniref:UPF0251 protein Gferi_20165 n=1 Tax=Geosporobacter ferrireducens TaxID=1424294 RepID=A0A1D8GL65_9FIRM|nr:DUF134 domain-containing protein [Geosporobacter ferrireducens]AOT71647.1 hypothetical protein Gferi_20165 [Geosporobacter ferrireducens]MTI55413.1 DUF134 domain-containing protein [Geosporobacter ferrireducens]